MGVTLKIKDKKSEADQTASLTKYIEYHKNKPGIYVLMKTETRKEIRAAFKKR